MCYKQRMELSKAKYYPFKVWLFTILFAPIFHILFILFYHYFEGSWEIIKGFFDLSLIGAFIALPSLLIYFVVFKLLSFYLYSERLSKSIMIIVGLALFIITKGILDSLFSSDFYHPKNVAFYSIYCLCIIVAGLYYNYPSKAPSPQNSTKLLPFNYKKLSTTE